MKVGTWPNSKVLSSNLILFFENFGPNYLIWAFWVIFGQKYKMLRFTWNLVHYVIRRCWVQIWYNFWNILDLNYLIWALWVIFGLKYKMLRSTWNLVPDLIQRWWFQIWHYFLKLWDLEYLSWAFWAIIKFEVLFRNVGNAVKAFLRFPH